MHTLLVIAIFFLMIFLPVIAAQVSRRRRGGKHDSGSRPVVRSVSDGPVVTHHVRPRPRKRARH